MTVKLNPTKKHGGYRGVRINEKGEPVNNQGFTPRQMVDYFKSQQLKWELQVQTGELVTLDSVNKRDAEHNEIILSGLAALPKNCMSAAKTLPAKYRAMMEKVIQQEIYNMVEDWRKAEVTKFKHPEL